MLPTGIRLVTVPVAKLPVVTVLVIIDAGSTDDPPGKEGVAALTAGLLLEGTAHFSGAELAEKFERLGASVARDTTAIVISDDNDRGRRFFNPHTGERITFLAIAEETGGELTRMEIRVRSGPGDWVGPDHFHPFQEERFEIVAGAPIFRINDELRARDYPALATHTYLDFTAANVYARSQIARHLELLQQHLIGNPHSTNPSSSVATEYVTRARQAAPAAIGAHPLGAARLSRRHPAAARGAAPALPAALRHRPPPRLPGELSRIPGRSERPDLNLYEPSRCGFRRGRWTGIWTGFARPSVDPVAPPSGASARITGRPSGSLVEEADGTISSAS